jgi:hypothetical protein
MFLIFFFLLLVRGGNAFDNRYNNDFGKLFLAILKIEPSLKHFKNYTALPQVNLKLKKYYHIFFVKKVTTR